MTQRCIKCGHSWGPKVNPFRFNIICPACGEVQPKPRHTARRSTPSPLDPGPVETRAPLDTTNKAPADQNLRTAVVLNLLLPGTGYLYMKRWIVGLSILSAALCALFLFPPLLLLGISYIPVQYMLRLEMVSYHARRQF